MIRRSTFLAASILLTATGVTQAFGQEAIMLETIGAVRMLPPQEVQHLNDDAAARERQPRAEQPTAVAQRHADVR